jgi:hypothetical protein
LAPTNKSWSQKLILEVMRSNYSIELNIRSFKILPTFCEEELLLLLLEGSSRYRWMMAVVVLSVLGSDNGSGQILLLTISLSYPPLLFPPREWRFTLPL